MKCLKVPEFVLLYFLNFFDIENLMLTNSKSFSHSFRLQLEHCLTTLNFLIYGLKRPLILPSLSCTNHRAAKYLLFLD